jgi:hypothetical protein
MNQGNKQRSVICGNFPLVAFDPADTTLAVSEPRTRLTPEHRHSLPVPEPLFGSS